MSHRPPATRHGPKRGQSLVAAGLFVAGVATLAAAVLMSTAPTGPPGDVPQAVAAPPVAPTAAPDRPTPGHDPRGRRTADTNRETGRSPAASSPLTRSPLPDRPAAAAMGVPVARPVTVEIPTIGVEASLVDLDLDQDRRLQVPDDPARGGWYVRGPRPGEDGPAVVAGHVDSQAGPAVFWRLGELAPGDRITVHDAERTRHVFVVDRVERWPKDDFPTDAVYRQSHGPELRLITCGGAFDRDTGHYRDNVIVFATAAHQPASGQNRHSPDRGGDR